MLITEEEAISCNFLILILCDTTTWSEADLRTRHNMGKRDLKVLFCHCKRQSFRQHQKKILKLSKIDKRISTFEISLFDFEKYCYYCRMYNVPQDAKSLFNKHQSYNYGKHYLQTQTQTSNSKILKCDILINKVACI